MFDALLLNLKEKQFKVLSEAGIEISPMELSDGKTAYLVGQEDFGKIAGLLNVAIRQTNNTVWQGIKGYGLEALLKQSGRVQAVGIWEKKQIRDGYTEIVDAILPSDLDKTIFLIAPRAEFVPPTTGGKTFCIYLHEPFPGMISKIMAPETLFGHKVCERENTFRPSGLGIPIFDENGSCVVAELFDDCLYVHLSISGGCDESKAIFSEILERAVVLLSDTDQALLIQCRRQELDSLVQSITADLRQSEKELTDKLGQKRKETDTARNTIEKIARELQELERLYQTRASEDEATFRGRVTREIQDLLRNDWLRHIGVGPGYIDVFTHKICCQDLRTGILHELGEYRITIPLRGDISAITMWNLTRMVEGHHGPHLNGEGKPCFGTAGPPFAKLLDQGEYIGAIYYAIAFLQSVNTDDKWGTLINRWPKARSSSTA